jgi:hypothetical protein
MFMRLLSDGSIKKAASKDAAGRAINDGTWFAFPTPELPGSGSKGRPERTLSQMGYHCNCFVIEGYIQHSRAKVNAFLTQGAQRNTQFTFSFSRVPLLSPR